MEEFFSSAEVEFLLAFTSFIITTLPEFKEWRVCWCWSHQGVVGGNKLQEEGKEEEGKVRQSRNIFSLGFQLMLET